MVADLSFKVAKRNQTPITFEIEGEDYTYSFVPPKQAVAFMPVIDGGSDNEMVMAKAGFDWLDQGLSEEDRKRIRDRMMDPKDDLDIEAVSEIIEGLIEAEAGRPTT
jgi:hypothetical protein